MKNLHKILFLSFIIAFIGMVSTAQVVTINPDTTKMSRQNYDNVSFTGVKVVEGNLTVKDFVLTPQ